MTRIKYLDRYIADPQVEKNAFQTQLPHSAPLPTFESVRHLLPEPFWQNHESAIKCWWEVWQLAFKNLRQPQEGSGFISNYIDTAFNNCLFMWDSVFILMFARYGSRAFDFQQTLDNLYAKQHPDGFICRELRQSDGGDQFHRHDPSSTGPNVLGFSEWEYFRTTGDKQRLQKVFPALLAYHRWMRKYRSWPDGSYWSTGWGCGMDNQPRTPRSEDRVFHHGHMSWVDATFQALLSARILVDMATELGGREDTGDLEAEIEHLNTWTSEFLWDEKNGFYKDRDPKGKLSDVLSIGAYWSLLTGAVTTHRAERMADHLSDPGLFNRPHRIPSLAAAHPEYRADGGYWCGGVWPPTNYMVLRGLTYQGFHSLAREIGRNHHSAVVEVYEKTGTVWENYAPESMDRGNPSVKDFVGWGGLGPIAVFLEYVLGIQANIPLNKITWHVDTVEHHGVKRYPFGPRNLVNLSCERRSTIEEKPRITASSTDSVELEIVWKNGTELLHCTPQGVSL